MLKNILQTFLPWILYFLLAGHTQAQMNLALSIGMLTALIFERKGLKKGFILSYGTIAFFSLMFIGVIIFKNAWIIKNIWIISHGTLALIAWISLFLRRPFTLQYAKEKVSADKWQHPLFIKINYILTATWGCIFLFGFLLNIFHVYYSIMNDLWYETFTNGATIFGIWFSVWFPQWYRKKQMKKM